VPFQIGFNRRFDPAYAEVGRAVRAGEIGPSSSSAASPPTRARAGGVHRGVGRLLPRLGDPRHRHRALRRGEVERVTALGARARRPALRQVRRRRHQRRHPRVRSGALGVLMNSRRTVYGHDLRLEVHGAKGKLVAEDERATKVWRYGPGGPRGDYYHHFLDRFRDAYRLEVQAFVDAVRAGRAPEPGAVDAVESLRVADAAVPQPARGAPGAGRRGERRRDGPTPPTSARARARGGCAP
jgi:myo-inositol 2-dehydrogenase / D-chiro-inositol 1-dehydrogenase